LIHETLEEFMTKRIRQHTNKAILILESPWELDDGDANRSSVLPFVEGVAKIVGDIEVYHANFYDKPSFEKALDCLCKTKFKNSTVYIAAHGYKKKVGKVNIFDLLYLIGQKSKDYNITGVMLGTCFVGENTSTMQVCIEGTNLKWCAGYSSSSTWLEGTFIDCAILEKMTYLDPEFDFSEDSTFIDSFAQALAPFSNSFPIGYNYREKPIRLDVSMQFVIQPTGKGKHAKTVSSEVFKAKNQLQLP
jgi:hypothetical protein